MAQAFSSQPAHREDSRSRADSSSVAPEDTGSTQKAAPAVAAIRQRKIWERVAIRCVTAPQRLQSARNYDVLQLCAYSSANYQTAFDAAQKLPSQFQQQKPRACIGKQNRHRSSLRKRSGACQRTRLQFTQAARFAGRHVTGNESTSRMPNRSIERRWRFNLRYQVRSFGSRLALLADSQTGRGASARAGRSEKESR